MKPTFTNTPWSQHLPLRTLGYVTANLFRNMVTASGTAVRQAPWGQRAAGRGRRGRKRNLPSRQSQGQAPKDKQPRKRTRPEGGGDTRAGRQEGGGITPPSARGSTQQLVSQTAALWGSPGPSAGPSQLPAVPGRASKPSAGLAVVCRAED